MATVLPRMLSFLLLPLYTEVLPTDAYGQVSVIFAWFAIFNVVLAYGMETAFFRFYSDHENREHVVSTSLVSIAVTTLVFIFLAITFQSNIANWMEVKPTYLRYGIAILALDAMVIIPFTWLRANGKAMRYAVIKLLNVAINLGLNLWFLWVLPMASKSLTSIESWYRPGKEIEYIFLSMLVASIFTFLLMSGHYYKRKLVLDKVIWKRMIHYAAPILVAGLAYAVNEVSDRILLKYLLPPDVADSEIGMYSACYKMALFMTLFATAFRLGIEPFFFSHYKSKNPQKAYAQITNYFVVLGSIIMLGVVVYADWLKLLLIRNEAYWEAMDIVPIIVLANFCLGIYYNLSVWYKVTDLTVYGAYISLIGAVLTIVINVALIRYFGYKASAVATLVAYSAMMVISFFFGKIRYPIPYNFRKITFYMGLSTLLAMLSFYGFNRNIWIGTLFFLLFLGLVYRMENQSLKQILFKNEGKDN